MNTPKNIQIELLSDAAFSRGEGTAGIVDVEVEHDDFGLPFIGGKTVRGLLRDSWLSMRPYFTDLHHAANRVFGFEADLEDRSVLRIGDAVVESNTRQWIERAESRKNHPLSSLAVLEALTDIRKQTAEDRETGAPAETSLRSLRVVVRGLQLYAPLHWQICPEAKDLQCLSLALLATRHAGLGRNRGLGHIRMAIDGNIERTIIAAKGVSA